MVSTRLGFLIVLTWTILADKPLHRVGELSDPAIREASGIVASRRFPGIYWVHNDSGNPAELFAVRRSGALVRSYRVAAPNVDWEDIALDDAGSLYIGDMGDNKSVLPVHAIYQLDEPDPTVEAGAAAPLPVVATHFYTYPEQRRHNAEGLVIGNNQALIVTKRRDGQPAEIYRVDLNAPAPLLHPAQAQLVGILPGCAEPVTGATLSPSGKLLAVVTESSLRVFRAVPPDQWQPLESISFDVRDVEAVTWDGSHLVLASEDRSLYELTPRLGNSAP